MDTVGISVVSQGAEINRFRCVDCYERKKLYESPGQLEITFFLIYFFQALMARENSMLLFLAIFVMLIVTIIMLRSVFLFTKILYKPQSFVKSQFFV